MPDVTYHVVVAFDRDAGGDLVVEEPVTMPGPSEAVEHARSLAATKTGVIAFSRTGDAARGAFSEVVLFEAGDVPDGMFDSAEK